MIRPQQPRSIPAQPPGRARARAESTLDVHLGRMQRLVMQGELAATAVHEISNLQTIVLFNAGLLREQHREDAAVLKYIDPLLHAASLVATLCNQLRNLARPVEALPQRLDLNETAQGTCRLLERIIGRKLTFTGAGGPVPVLADPGQIDQMLINLVLNARDATPEEGGVIDVRVRAGSGPRARHALEVEDNGTGMTPEVKARLFRKFFTTKEPGRGTGLGLVTVQRMMRNLGGRIELRSRAGQGTRFRLLFPPASISPEDHHENPQP
jgi:two-component system cell cycle sensor histidine kinase/response regulator CckA